MKSLTLKSLPALATGLFLLIAVTGCNGLFGGDDPAEVPQTTEYDDSYYSDLNLSLDDANGGYDATAESPGFGDPEFARMFPEDVAAGDALQNDVEILAIEADPASRVTYLRVAWGQLQRERDQEIVTDWSGTIRVDRGAIVVLRRIQFEPLTDWIVFPREDEKLVELFSQTSSRFDGLLLKIVDPDPASGEPNALTLELGTATFTMPVGELAGYSEILDTDDLGNQLSVQSPAILGCPNGFLNGIWVGDGPGHARGIFRGAVLAYGGGLLGHMRGHWGVNDADERVFRGKMIDTDGAFLAFVEGNWSGGGGDLSGRGAFEGVMLNENDMVTGSLGGHFRLALRRGGFLAGRWVEICEP